MRGLLILAFMYGIMCRAENMDCMVGDSTETAYPKTVTTDSVKIQQQGRTIGPIRKTIRGFSKIDERYIEPQHYNWALMAQGTFNYDLFELAGSDGKSIRFSPDVTMKIGPYFGWRWLFLGYTFDLKNISFNTKRKGKTELDFSLYSNQIGVDFYYRRTGSDYKIRHARLGDGSNIKLLEGMPLDCIKIGITGASLYYIFNHNRFSYPAAFAQSTRQKISCGSWMAGIGYTRNSLELNYDKMENALEKRLGYDVQLDSSLLFNSLKYYNVNANVGYAYNWVFTKHWLVCASASLVVAYKRQQGDVTDDKSTMSFVLNNFNIDGTGRLAVVYNNDKWYVGTSALMFMQNYTKSRFECQNIFGSINVYCGFNFGVKDKYRKKKNKVDDVL